MSALTEVRSLRVMVVEDDPTVADDLRRRIEESELTLAGVFEDGEVAIAAIHHGLEVDVSLVDLQLPRMSGRELIGKLRIERPGLEILVLTIFEDDESLYGALRAGASGYLLKDASFDDVIQAVRQVHGGGAPMTPSIARRVLLEFRGPEASKKESLTGREREVLELLTRGASYPLIGKALDISTNTVQSHIRAIYSKLEVSTKAEATAEAYRRGLVR